MRVEVLITPGPTLNRSCPLHPPAPGTVHPRSRRRTSAHPFGDWPAVTLAGRSILGM